MSKKENVGIRVENSKVLYKRVIFKNLLFSYVIKKSRNYIPCSDNNLGVLSFLVVIRDFEPIEEGRVVVVVLVVGVAEASFMGSFVASTYLETMGVLTSEGNDATGCCTAYCGGGCWT